MPWQPLLLAAQQLSSAVVDGAGVTSQAQIVDLAGSNTSPAAVSGIVSTSQAQIVDLGCSTSHHIKR